MSLARDNSGPVAAHGCTHLRVFACFHAWHCEVRHLSKPRPWQDVQLWWLNYCFCEGVGIGAVGNPFFGGEAVNICLHSRCEMTDIGDPCDPFAPTSVFAYASLISAPCLQHLDPQFAFASTKSLLVVTDGAASSCLIGLLALVIPSGSTTSFASVSASLPHKPMDVLSLLSRSRSCASRVEPSCVPQWALVCASGNSVPCHQLRVLPRSLVSICWTRRAPPPSHSHIWILSQVSTDVFLSFADLLASCQWNGVSDEASLHGFLFVTEPCRISQDGIKTSWRFNMSTCDVVI